MTIAAPALRTTRRLLAGLALVLLGAGCAPTQPTARVLLPPANGQFDYQLGGPYQPASGVAVVDRDVTATPVAGRYSICYVNAFQTQPEQLTWWQQHHPELLLRDSSGRQVADPNWPGEVLLDTSTAAGRQGIAAVVGADVDRCRTKGFQAVEPDNLDSWTRSHGVLTRADNTAMARLLTARAHADGLAIGQKNTAELAPTGKALGFDFAVAEECQVYAECDVYTKAYGAQVFEVEYTDNGTAAFAAACRARGARISVILRDRDVVPAGDPAYRYSSC